MKRSNAVWNLNELPGESQLHPTVLVRITTHGIADTQDAIDERLQESTQDIMEIEMEIDGMQTVKSFKRLLEPHAYQLYISTLPSTNDYYTAPLMSPLDSADSGHDDEANFGRDLFPHRDLLLQAMSLSIHGRQMEEKTSLAMYSVKTKDVIHCVINMLAMERTQQLLLD